jgi:hypothetical protein
LGILDLYERISNVEGTLWRACSLARLLAAIFFRFRQHESVVIGNVRVNGINHLCVFVPDEGCNYVGVNASL